VGQHADGRARKQRPGTFARFVKEERWQGAKLPPLCRIRRRLLEPEN
jgi:hypothetical protein